MKKCFSNPVEIIREALQNSVDENARNVFCRVFQESQPLSANKDLVVDIWDDGAGLARENAGCFFGLAKTTKMNKDGTRIQGKLGYKGHGTKIFFNSDRVEIVSKTQTRLTTGARSLKAP